MSVVGDDNLDTVVNGVVWGVVDLDDRSSMLLVEKDSRNEDDNEEEEDGDDSQFVVKILRPALLAQQCCFWLFLRLVLSFWLPKVPGEFRVDSFGHPA